MGEFVLLPVAHGSHLSRGVVRAVAQQAESHYRQAPLVTSTRGGLFCRPSKFAVLVHQVASVPATAAQMAQLIELLRNGFNIRSSARLTEK
jgi:hypothetical protein